jgi:hypothetical protein
MLGVEMVEARAIRRRLNRTAVAGSRPHAIVEQRLFENLAADTAFDRPGPEVEQLEGRDALVESVERRPQPPPRRAIPPGLPLNGVSRSRPSH